MHGGRSPAGEPSISVEAPDTSPPDAEAAVSVVAFDPWLLRVGWPDRRGLEPVRAAVAEAIAEGPGSLTVSLSWPSPPAAPLLAWAGRAVAGEGDPVGDGRILFAGMASGGARLLASMQVDRQVSAAAWRPASGVAVTPRRDAMATAFLPRRLMSGAPAALPCTDLVPLLQVNGRVGVEPWASRWGGFLRSARGFVGRGHRGRYGLPSDRYGETASSRPFGFLVPRASSGRRRSEEIAAIPGDLDVVVLDLSPRWVGPWNVAEALETALVDLKAGRPYGALPPILALVSDPRCALAAMRVGSEARTRAFVLQTRLRRVAYLGQANGVVDETAREEPRTISVHAAATHEAEIVQALLELAEAVHEHRPETAEALAGAADALSAMARTTRPPLAAGEHAEQRYTFVDAELEVRDALRREGDPPERMAMDRALQAGREAASRLMRETPAHLALQEARRAAATGQRVGFVADQVADAVAARSDAPAGLIVVARYEAFDRLRDERLDRLVIASRGADALRLLVELPRPGQDVVLVLAPNEAAIAGRLAQHLSSWPEYAGLAGRCAAVTAALPPTLGKLLDLAAKAPPTRGAKPLRPTRTDTGFRAAAEVVVLFDDGSEEGFAPGSDVVVLFGDVPRVKPASELVAGDAVVLPPQSVSDEVAREMGWDGEAALLDDEVGRYKARLAAWRRGEGAATTVKAIVAKMRVIDPDMPTPHASTVRYWLSAAGAQQDPAPRASADPRWFAAFCAIVGYGDGGDPHALGERFDAHRARLRRDGKLRRCLVERFVFDRYDAALHRNIASADVDRLRSRLLSYVRGAVEVHRGGEGRDP